MTQSVLMLSESSENLAADFTFFFVCYFQPLVAFQASNVSLSRKSLQAGLVSPVIMSPELTAWLSSLILRVGRDKDRSLVSLVSGLLGPVLSAGLVVGAKCLSLVLAT